MTNENTTHFGFKQVAKEDKVNLVRGVFDSVAGQYDIMNDLMHQAFNAFESCV
jgi:demethylmenaquinone methyltransferase/2-methoxy-6-polyprenyl-1,4-benzoquinol methylase